MDGVFGRYGAMVRAVAERALGAPPAQAAPRGATATLGCRAALLLLRDDAALHPLLAAGLRGLGLLAAEQATATPLLEDGSGHRRDVYYPFVLRLHLRAFGARFEQLPQAVWSACEDALPAALGPLRAVEQWAGTTPPPEQVTMTLWRALVIGEQAALLSRDVDLEVIDGVIHHALGAPGVGGSLHARGAEESLDAWTYRELTGLHALAAAALLRRNPAWARRVEEVALYHLEHTQPDYTTTQPWGLFAAAWSGATRPLADQQLLDVESTVATAGPASAVAQAMPMLGMLLADAADSFARLG